VFAPEFVLPARRILVAVVTSALALAALTPLAAPGPTHAATPVFINEFHYDNDGTDVGEFVEIAAPAGTSLTGWSIVLYNGSTGQTYDTDELSGTVPNQQNGFGTFALSYPVNGIQNGTVDAIALVQGTTVVQFLGYEGSFLATNGPAVGMTSTDIGVAEGGTAPIGTSLSLQGTGTAYEDFTWATGVDDSPGAVNTGQTFGTDPAPVAVCGPAVVTTAGTQATTGVSASDATGRVVDIAITGVTPAEPNITIGATTPAGAVGGTASATVTVGAATAAGSYAVQITATNDDASPQTGTCVLNVTVNAPVTTGIVISQLYGGGGNAGATLTNDFIELFNATGAPISVGGWSVQYASAAGTSWQVTPLAGTIPAGGYYLVQEGAGAGGTQPLPAPDATGAILMSATSGKVILSASATALSGACPAGTVDLVGYGAANCFEGSAAVPALTNTTAAIRDGGGCVDTDDNFADFTTGTPLPRNSSTALSACSGISVDDVTAAEGQSGTTAMRFTVSLTDPAGPGGVTFDIATADDSATAGSDYVGSSLTGQSIPEGSSSYAFDVAVNGDTAVEFAERFLVNLTNVIGVGVMDGQGVGTIANDDCGEPFTPIPSIQGNGSSAALTGLRATQGVVVGDFEGAAAVGGFFIQDPVGDGDPATSDGIFVFTGTANTASEGDLVRVEGFAHERFGQTAFNGSGDNADPVPPLNVVHCGTGAVATTEVEMPFASSTDPERFEGMKVRFPQSLVIAEYFNYGRFGEMVLALPLPGETRPFTGTAIDEPGAAANARTLANSLRRITLDDNQSAQNPPVLRHPNGLAFSLANRFRGGDHVQNTVGVLGFDFSLYRIFPTGPADYSATNGRPTTPEPVGGTLRVAAMNTLNFFLTLDETPSDSGVSGPCGGNANLDCRGADANADPPDDPIVDQELPRQRAKLLQALAGLDADVLGLNELENTPGVDPVSDIVAGLNEMDGVGPYAAIDTGPIGTDAIKVGLVYNPQAVVPVGAFQVLSSADDPRFIDTKSRPALAQTFEEIATGARFTVVVNHLKSKGSDCLDVDLDPGPGVDPDNDLGDGQGNCNGTRTLAAQALVDWIASDPTGSGYPDFLIMGDLNSYAMEDPIDAIKAGADDEAGTGDDWTNLIALHQGTYAYSYVFDGQSGYLDHALANASIAGQVAGAADWHINADEPSVLDYDVSFKPEAQDRLYEADRYRTSDHDPVVVGLDLINEAPTIVVSAGISCSATANGGSFALTVDDNEQDVEDLVLSIEGNTNAALVSNANVVFGGSGADRSVSITATSKKSGTAVLTIGVSDGWNTATVTITVQVGTDANESFGGTAGADLLVGGAGNDTLTGLAGADVLCGGQGVDTATGGDGNDAVDGGHGDDVVSGGAGIDDLRGGQGDDSLTGGAGADAFSGGSGADTNTDFNAGDGDTSDGT
jgi:predicted extracellular nuclease